MVGVVLVVRLDSLGPDFDEFVHLQSTSLLRTAYLLTGDHGHAEDLVQTALLRTARRWNQARDEPLPYTRQVLVNLAKDRWRNRGRRVAEVADTAETLAVSDTYVASELDQPVLLRHALLPAIRELTARQRAVLVLRFFLDLSVEETAATLGCSTGTVKSQTHHALARLRERLHLEDLEDQKETDHAHR